MNEAPLTKSDQVYQTLRGWVLSGELAPGQRLVQRVLAERLGVSSIPVLEAIRRLEHDGLVVSHANFGAAVRVWSAEDIEGAYLAREALEGIAARLFVQRATPAERAVLRALADEVEAALAAGETAASRDADMRFHRHLVAGTHADTLARLVENSCLVTLTILYRAASETGRGRSPLPGEHEVLADTLLNGTADEAEQALRGHIRRGLTNLMGAVA
ncbi:MAG: GntR family transcriptional regulator [Armatimonadetes bacterium]|nr:GntR family transcriptional regulator [Armatimonadota bacterium]